MKKKSVFAGLALVAALVCETSCSTAQQHKSFDSSSTKTLPTALSHETAWLRSKQIGQVAYTLWFGIDEDRTDFEGRTVVNFQLKDLKKIDSQDSARVVSLDFEGGTIRSIRVNGATVGMGDRYDGHRIYFHTNELAATGSNRIEIAFSHPFNEDGHGFHRFKDPVDGNVYTYTDFEPYQAHRLFPCFDQPDIKASYELTVEAPDSWQVISNTMEREVTRVDGRKSWAFPPSPLLSTYVFALHAGPYVVWKGDAKGIPTRLFARKSLKQYVDHAEWLDVTRRGLEFYQEQFGYPYPYAKYDQILVPDFNEGAMENAGAVTFSEHFVHRTPPTVDQRRNTADVILHEMAHMWFGDLVTMRWWNGLWLNESFATYMAAKATAEATNFPGSWENFASDMKSWAYWEDQLVTTHPIEVPVPDTDHAKTVFDGISYGKGASVIKQLVFYLGEDDFREGIQRYFQKYALRNTTTNEFIKMLAEASGKDLVKWQKTWLMTPGVNGLRADWACGEDGKISRFALVQTPPEGSTELRPHKTKVAFFKRVGGKLSLRDKDVFTVEYSAAENPVSEAVGKACPAFVFPNYEDHDYAKVELDPISLETAKQSLATVDNTMLRGMLWGVLWQMVVDGKMRAQDYADAVMSQGAKEKNTDILESILSEVTRISATRPSAGMYVDPAVRPAYFAKVEDFTMKHLKTAPGGSDLQRVWWDHFDAAAFSPKGAKFAQALLDGKAALPGFKIGQEERWALLGVLARSGNANAQDLITEELKKDNTDMGNRAAIRAEVAIPDTQSKSLWLKRFLSPLNTAQKDVEEIPVSRLREGLRGYYSLLQEDTVKNSETAYYEALPKLTGISENPYSDWFANNLYPFLCSPEGVAKTAAVLSSKEGEALPAGVIKSLKIGKQEQERCIRARALSVSSVQK